MYKRQRNVCGTSVIGELVGFEVAVWVVVAIMSLVSFGFGASLLGDFRTRRLRPLVLALNVIQGAAKVWSLSEQQRTHCAFGLDRLRSE